MENVVRGEGMHFRQLTIMVKSLEKFEKSIKFYETITELTISRRLALFHLLKKGGLL